MKSKILLSIIFLLNVALNANEISLSASISKQKTFVNDRINYEVSMQGNIPQQINVNLPNLKDKFEIIGSSESTSFSIINGKMSSSKTKKYTLVPLKKGNFLIGATEIKINNKVYKTNTLQVEVAESIAQPKGPSISNSSVIQRSNINPTYKTIFLEASTDKKTAYLGEQVIYRLNFYRSIRLWNNITFEPPVFKNFSINELAKKKDHYLVKINSKRYYAFELVNNALFPNKVGELTITPGRVNALISPFEGSRILSSEAIKLKVIPLPLKNKPNYFTGTVGDFQMSAEISTQSTKVNSPITVKVTIEGEGNFKSISDLKFEKNSSMKVYKAKSKESLNFEEKLTGTKTIEYVVIPQEDGKLKTPKFYLSYFSPSIKKYKTVSIDSFLIQVDKGADPKSSNIAKKEVELLLKEVNYIREGVDLNEFQYSHKTLLFLIALLINSLLFLTSIYLLLKNSFFKFFFKPNQLNDYIKIATKKLTSLSKNKITSKELTEVQNILLEALSIKLSKSIRGLTDKELVPLLSKAKFSKELVGDITQTLAKLSFSIFAPTEKKNTYSLTLQTLKIITQLKRTFK